LHPRIAIRLVELPLDGFCLLAIERRREPRDVSISGLLLVSALLNNQPRAAEPAAEIVGVRGSVTQQVTKHQQSVRCSLPLMVGLFTPGPIVVAGEL
jgi:hypothetical protein